MLAIVGGRIMTITNGTLENGTLLLDGGKIVGVGKDLPIPEEARIIDAKGRTVTPGLIDCHTHLANFGSINTMPGLQKDGNESSDPITPQVRAMDALNPFDPAIECAMKAGFTTCNTMPGSANIIGGNGVVFKLTGRTAEEMVIPGKEVMKFALGENPKRFYGTNGKQPVTRMGTAALLRETLRAAKDYSDALLDFEAGKGEKPKRDGKLEALVRVVRGQQRCRIHCHRADDIMTAIRIAKEFSLDFILEHATEGHKIADILAKEGVTCVIGPLLLPPLKQEVWEIRRDNPAILNKAGVTICLTADEGYDTQWLPVDVGVIVRYGLPEKAAMEAITINPARVLQVEDRVGSLEVGKDADVAVFNGNPLCNITACVMTIIDGKICHDQRG